MGAWYRRFCPVAKAMELLDERWTLLVVRELLSGSRHFNQLRRGVPRMSPALLTKRLRRLERAGIIERRPLGNRVDYVLTEAGRELQPVVEALGGWGIRWIGEIGVEDLDPQLLLWDMHRNVDLNVVPPGRTVVEFCFSDVPPIARHWWLVITPDDVDVCDVDPGYPVTVTVTTALPRMVEISHGDQEWAHALPIRRAGHAGRRGHAPRRPRWFTLSAFAKVSQAAIEDRLTASSGCACRIMSQVGFRCPQAVPVRDDTRGSACPLPGYLRRR